MYRLILTCLLTVFVMLATLGTAWATDGPNAIKKFWRTEVDDIAGSSAMIEGQNPPTYGFNWSFMRVYIANYEDGANRFGESGWYKGFRTNHTLRAYWIAYKDGNRKEGWFGGRTPIPGVFDLYDVDGQGNNRWEFRFAGNVMANEDLGFNGGTLTASGGEVHHTIVPMGPSNLKGHYWRQLGSTLWRLWGPPPFQPQEDTDYRVIVWDEAATKWCAYGPIGTIDPCPQQ